jgi:type IV pilus assembly protein PilM
MFKFASKWFGPKANPIGIDFGSDCLKLAQIAIVNGEPQLIAAAAAEVPGHIRHIPSARLNFFTETLKELLSSGGFKDRDAVLALPSASMFIQHLRLAKMDEEMLRKALPWEVRGKIPIDPSHALLRHVVAGEVYHDSEPKNEVIVMAAARQLVNDMLSAASKAKLNVIGMNVEPSALIDCFGHIYRRKEDKIAVSCYVDIGSTSSRAIIAQGSQILFARTIKIGGDHLNRAVAASLKLNLDDAKMLRIKLCYQHPSLEDPHQKQSVELEEKAVAPQRVNRKVKFRDGSDSSLDGGVAVATEDETSVQQVDSRTQYQQVSNAVAEPLAQLAAELDLCRRYYESTFPSKPVDRLIFVGGEAKHRTLCQYLAGEMGLPAQVGDPLVRMGRTTQVGIESGMDRRQAQPGWAVAIGLSLGSVNGTPSGSTQDER